MIVHNLTLGNFKHLYVIISKAKTPTTDYQIHKHFTK